MLETEIQMTKGSLQLDVALAVGPGETVAVVGPNGAGKTTLLRGLSGLDPLESGHVTINGVDQRATAPRGRPVATVFQDLRLFPHLSALDNVAFPLRAAGTGRADARTRAGAALEALDIADALWTRRPAALSGGEAQRVALARALIRDPAVLLLDEPFASLDAAARPRARAAVASALDRFGGAAVLVTHDPADALVLADWVVVIESGHVTQTGSVADIARRPNTTYAARLVGTNLLVGHGSDDGTVAVAQGMVVRTAEAAPAGPVRVVIAPAAVSLLADRPVGSPRNIWSATVASIEPIGSRVRVEVVVAETGVGLVAEVTFGAVSELGLRPGSPCWASVKATEVDVVSDRER